jgi:hypothetical protein
MSRIYSIIGKITSLASVGAVRIGEKRMAVFEDRAMLLLKKYFPETKEKL